MPAPHFSLASVLHTHRHNNRIGDAEVEHTKFVAQVEKANMKQKGRMGVIQREQAQELMALQQRLSDQRSQML